MSHRATNWAIQQRGLKPATKIVLWHLCDRHNPDFGCFPTQVRLAADAEMSVSALNEHLAKLEAAGLIRRLRTHDLQTHRRQATRYILGFEMDGPVNPGPETGDGSDGSSGDLAGEPAPVSADGAISGKPGEPSPDFDQSQLRNPDTNLVREPLKEPVKEEEDAQAREDEFEEFFAELLGALGFSPEAALPAWWQGWPARTHVRRWRDDLGLSEARIIAVAQESRQDHPAPPDGPRALDRFMERAARRDALAAEQQARGGRGAAGAAKGHGQRRQGAPLPRPSAGSIAEFYAGLVNSDRYLPASTISNTIRDEMLARGLVTLERLRMRGVR